MTTEFFQFFGMGLEVVSDDDDVGAGVVGRVHRFRRTDTAAYDKRDGNGFAHRFDDICGDRRDRARTGL